MAEESDDDGEADEAWEDADSDAGDPAVVFLPEPLPLGEPDGGMFSPPVGALFGGRGFGLGAEGDATPPNAALEDVDGRLARLRESRDAITRQIAAAERERSAIVDPEIPVEEWVRIIRQRVASLDDDEARQSGRGMVRSLMRTIGRTGSVVIEEGVARGVDDEALLAVRGQSPPWPLSTRSPAGNAEGFPGRRRPHPAADHFFRGLPALAECRNRAPSRYGPPGSMRDGAWPRIDRDAPLPGSEPPRVCATEPGG